MFCGKLVNEGVVLKPVCNGFYLAFSECMSMSILHQHAQSRVKGVCPCVEFPIRTVQMFSYEVGQAVTYEPCVCVCVQRLVGVHWIVCVYVCVCVCKME